MLDQLQTIQNLQKKKVVSPYATPQKKIQPRSYRKRTNAHHEMTFAKHEKETK